ncbi:hypothetical protein Dimus_017894 [Dionaea muscipula]
MASLDRSKKKLMLWQKAVVHFLLCFVMGFFTGFAPTNNPSPSSLPSRHEIATTPMADLGNSSFQTGNLNRSRTGKPQKNENQTQVIKLTRGNSDDEDLHMSESKKLVIVITPISNNDPLTVVLLRRLASTLKLVAQPMLWIIVESSSGSEGSGVSELLRKTGVIMYRHLVLKQNISDPRVEREHQRNLALNHIELHRLSGIVHFASLHNVYDLSFFHEIRSIEVFGTWPIAKLSSRRKKQIIEGPICYSSQVIGWNLKIPKNQTEQIAIHISSFAFNSSILWDPERWGRLSSSPDSKQNSLKFVRQAVHEDETELKGVPQDCSKVNLWQLHLSTKTTPFDHLPEHPSRQGNGNNGR